MLRFLTAIPPGKVRFTIIDPVGLGQNFAAFMHLKDFDELLVTSRIWTEPAQIDQRLLDLTEHMENVIQKYLRNEYASIEEYNVMAGEVAEPYRVLVVANFPANFSDTAQRRLVSIAQSGARCGVYVLVSLDTSSPNATRPARQDLEPNCVNLAWKENRFLWKDSPFEQYPLRLDAPPDDMRTQPDRQARRRGGQGRQARRGPFEVIAPADDKCWTWDSRSIVDVPLGRAGATKFQNLKLGKGTSQHMLIAGKTGSGKSTLLHALITNPALMYSPKELELYLIDFKKGVEFKTYAALQPAPRPRHRRRVRARVRPERAAAARRRAEEARRPVPRRRRPGRGRLPPDHRRAPAADPAAGGRVPGVLHRGRQALAGSRRSCSTAWSARAEPSASTSCSARRPSAVPTRWPGPRSRRWPSGSPCSAPRPTRT